MSKTNQNNCRYSGFIKAWRTFLEPWLYIAVVVFISTQIAMFAAQPALALPKLPQQSTDSGENTPQARPLPVPKELIPSTEPLNLYIKYLTTQLYNPNIEKNDDVKLRGYIDTNTNNNPKSPYIAPTIKVDPGDTLRINLHNNLPKNNNSCTKHKPEDVNTPHCFNNSNLHTHGLWISPAGNSDNVAFSINPGESFEYEYNIPEDHPAGTFWYHPHLHGSTALQVTSGMAGALIVNGNREPKVGKSKFNDGFIHGDIDTLLAGLNKSSSGSYAERILVLQEIQYSCQNNDDSTTTKCNNNSGQIGKIESYDFFTPTTWQQSGRYTSINGEVLPQITTTQGKIERWRIIHGGVRDTISLEFRKMKKNAESYSDLAPSEANDWIGKNCTGSPDPIKYYIIAEDGITRHQAWETQLTTLQPGNRNDALVVFPKAGSYCVIDKSASPSGIVKGGSESNELLAVVNVGSAAGTDITDIKTYMKKQLVAAANKRFENNTAVKQKVVNDLTGSDRNNPALKLTLFEPHPSITDEEVAHTHRQEMAFFMSFESTPRFEVSNGIGSAFNPKPYNPKRIDRKLKVGDAEEWHLASYSSGHPFHIHVNPFQIVKILDPKGKDVSKPGATDCPNGEFAQNSKTVCSNSKPDPQYPGLKGVWRDTIFVKEGYKVFVRTRYERYIGNFVQHCHILEHEDKGMMENISIVPASKFSH